MVICFVLVTSFLVSDFRPNVVSAQGAYNNFFQPDTVITLDSPVHLKAASIGQVALVDVSGKQIVKTDYFAPGACIYEGDLPAGKYIVSGPVKIGLDMSSPRVISLTYEFPQRQKSMDIFLLFIMIFCISLFTFAFIKIRKIEKQ